MSDLRRWGRVGADPFVFGLVGPAPFDLDRICYVSLESEDAQRWCRHAMPRMVARWRRHGRQWNDAYDSGLLRLAHAFPDLARELLTDEERFDLLTVETWCWICEERTPRDLFGWWCVFCRRLPNGTLPAWAARPSSPTG